MIILFIIFANTIYFVAQFNNVCMPLACIKVYVVYDFHNKDLSQKQYTPCVDKKLFL